MSQPYFVIDTDGSQTYAKDLSGDDVYPDIPEPFAKRIDGTFSYAKTASGDEVYPVVQGVPVFKPVSENDRTEVYARNKDGDEVYPVDPGTGEEVYRVDAATFEPIYAKTAQRDEVLPRDGSGREVEVYGIKAKDRLGKVAYKRDARGRPVYPLDANGDEFYELKNGLGAVLYGKDRHTGAEVYARKRNGDEFYPPGHPTAFAFDPNRSTYRYARSHAGEILFPHDATGNETYVFDPISRVDVTEPDDGQKLPRYARMKTPAGAVFVHEKYPQVHVDLKGFGFYERVLEHLGYRERDGRKRYPRDEFGNEYVVPGLADVYPSGYPTTWDLHPIVLGDSNGRPVFRSGDASVKEEHLERHVGREVRGYRDFVSSTVVTTRHKRSGKPYPTRNVVRGGGGGIGRSGGVVGRGGGGSMWKLGLALLSLVLILGILFFSFR